MNDPEPPDGTARRAPRLVTGGLILFALLALVSLASQSGFGHRSQPSASPRYVSWAFSIFLVLWVLAIPALAWGVYQQSAQAVTQRKSFKNLVIRRFVSVVLFCVLIGGALYLKENVHWHKPDSNAANAASRAAGADKAAPRNVAEPTFKWPVAVAFGGILAAASIPLTRVYLSERRRRQQRAGSSHSSTASS